MRREFSYKFNVVVVVKIGVTQYDDDGCQISPVCNVLKVISTDDYDELRKLVDEIKEEWECYDVEFFDARNGFAILDYKEEKLVTDEKRRFNGYAIVNYF